MRTKPTLLQKAKRVPGFRNKFADDTQEEIDLAVAWIKKEISYVQVSTILDIRGSNFYNFVATRLREAYRRGIIK